MYTLIMLTVFTVYDFLGPPPTPVREEVKTALQDPSVLEYLSGLIHEILDARKEEEEEAVTDALLDEIEPTEPPVVKVKTELTDVPVPVINNTNTEPEPTYRLNVYSLESCAPCARMLDELEARDVPFDWREYRYPQYTFHDGTHPRLFPSAELFREGRLIRRYAGYTSIDVIIQDITLTEAGYGQE